MAGKTFAEMFRDAMQTDEFWAEKAILEFTTGIYAEMKRQGKSYSDLARILNTSPAYITKVFRSNANFTIQSMVKLSRALNCKLHIHVAPKNTHVSWLNVVPISSDSTVGAWSSRPDNYIRVEKIQLGVKNNGTTQLAA